ncbi:MAG: S8 family serine peptidase, partial [Spirosomaceae bacterium]|nr:S8 family serine peptidase [Spirosomataceae bacterium]
MSFYRFLSIYIYLFFYTIEIVAQHKKEEGTLSELDITQNGIALLKNKYPATKADGIVICQKENLADTNDIDLLNKFIVSASASTTITNHATNIAQIMAGNGLSSEQNEGIAPQARLISTNFSVFFPNEDRFYIDNNVSVVNHSYGNDIDNRYSQEAFEFDNQVNRIPYLLHVFSSGNSGGLTANEGIYKNLNGFANLTGDYKMSKNTISVGACNSNNEIIGSSSRGPAHDGRVKPEVVAYSIEGTSYAAAVVSGTVAILQDFYREKYQKLPAASLIKSVLIASAKDIASPGPDYASGFGVINAYKAMKTIEDKHFLEASVKSNEVKSFKILIPKGIKNIRVCAVWTDPAAQPAAAKALVNDLDMTLQFKNNFWLPWVLSNIASLDSLKKTAVRSKDSINNVELISVDNPEEGEYNISIKANLIKTPNQVFYVSYYFEYDDSFVWVFPQTGNSLESNQKHIISWDSSLKTQIGAIEYSTDDQNWNTIVANTDLGKNWHEWIVGDYSSDVRLRVRTANNVFMSDKFRVEPRINIESKYNCGDSLGVSWNRLDSAQKYIIQQLNKQNLIWEKLLETTQNNVVLKNRQNEWLSIVPIYNDGKTGVRSSPINATRDRVLCFYESFEVLYNAFDNTNELLLTMTQTTGIKKIIFKKSNGSQFIAINEQEINSSTLNYSFTETDPDAGIGLYQVLIILENGNTITTDIKQVLILSPDKQVLVYPNPADEQKGFYLTIEYVEDETI